jgi:nitrogenase subunit NifH
MSELKNFFGEKLCATTVPRNIRLAEAPSHGKPALLYDPRSKGAESYIKLAKEIIERQWSVVSGQSSVAADSSTAADGPDITAVQEEEQGSAVGEIAAKDEMDKTA